MTIKLIATDNHVKSLRGADFGDKTAATYTIKHDVLLAAPAHGAKTVTTTAAALFASTAVKANRRGMKVTNMDESAAAYWGGASVSAANGYPLKAGAEVSFEFSPDTAVPIYFIAGANVVVRVVEW